MLFGPFLLNYETVIWNFHWYNGKITLFKILCSNGCNISCLRVKLNSCVDTWNSRPSLQRSHFNLSLKTGHCALLHYTCLRGTESSGLHSEVLILVTGVLWHGRGGTTFLEFLIHQPWQTTAVRIPESITVVFHFSHATEIAHWPLPIVLWFSITYFLKYVPPALNLYWIWK